ncbi:PREDICTED: McKusick-Kaufman/Bardet-Biedl syndromes putative chaperonin [Thamnophis sirtalis]|uniref:Molecular chaperone MKKS n=1 Tax=Thamnophis sirtalis TaxID=35019 RepID=A0A6I9XKB1_9SAUR|nr:PREDICTED: McKusick-Kaufman/Bardet-Biedl syndromes putative chaperonin [Thamnophis sirtalis]
MSRADVKKPSLCTTGPLTKEVISQAVSTFSKIMRSSYGPTGRLKQLHNGMGGYVRISSQSSVLLSSLCVTLPVLKLLVASLQNHLALFGDSGLFTAIFCCNLLEKYESLNMAPYPFIKISKHILSLCLDYLSSETCGCRIPVDFSSSKLLLSLVRSIISSKRACMLSRKEADHISILVLRAFLFTVPQNVDSSAVLGKCHYIPLKNKRVMDSTVYPGLLIEMPEMHLIPPFKRTPSGQIKVALFGMSMSGDLSHAGEGAIVIHHGISLEAEMLEQLLSVGREVITDGVGLVICQKVIHPTLKQYLKENNIVAVERVGIRMMEPLKKMTGSQPIPSLQFLSPACYGQLKDLQTQCFDSKWFLHLIPDQPVVCSLLLCNRNETAWDELKLACQTAERALQLTVKDPWILLGGGCTETHVSSYIKHKSCSVTEGTLEDLGCSSEEFHLVTDCFCHSLESIARSLEHDSGDVLTDTHWGHSWSIPPKIPSNSDWSDFVQKCGCGLCNKQEGLNWKMLNCRSVSFLPQNCVHESSVTPADHLVLDCFAAKRNGLQVAVETTHLILDISHIIEDRN